MAAMGIDLWVPQAAPCQQHSSTIWRDQSAPEVISEIILKNVPEQPIVQASTQLKQHAETPVTPVVEEKIETAEVVVSQVDIQPALQIAAFNLEAICLAHCVVIIDSTALSADQQVLWSNIQRAVSSDFFALQWPFAWINLQDGRGAGAYVQGFLDAISLDKNVICLGSIPHLNNTQVFPLASLQQMIEQPLLKKRLWQFMQKKAE